MSRGGGDATPPRAPAAAGTDGATFPPSTARDDAVALLQLTGLDTSLDRTSQSMAALLEPLQRQRSDLATLAQLIERDHRPQGTAQDSQEIVAARGCRLLRNQRTYAEIANALSEDEAGALAMSRELQRKTARLAQDRDKLFAQIPAPLRERYEAVVRDGQRPAVAAVQGGRCPGCGENLPAASRRLVEGTLCVVPCSGCLRLLYDRSAMERDREQSMLRPVTRVKP